MLTEAMIRESLSVERLVGYPQAEAKFEFWVPQSNERADVAVIGSTLDGFEIKTDRDTLKRLPRQAGAYGRVFDRCYAVLASRHIGQALELLPAWWGVILIHGDDWPEFEEIREAADNRGVDPHTLVRLLWRDEVFAALCELDMPPAPRAGRFQMWEQMLAVVEPDQLRGVVREALVRRESAGTWSRLFATTT